MDEDQNVKDTDLDKKIKDAVDAELAKKHLTKSGVPVAPVGAGSDGPVGGRSE